MARTYEGFGVEECRSVCEYFDLYGGGAPSNKLFENGSFASVETRHCSYTRKAVIDVTLDLMEAKSRSNGQPLRA